MFIKNSGSAETGTYPAGGPLFCCLYLSPAAGSPLAAGFPQKIPRRSDISGQSPELCVILNL